MESWPEPVVRVQSLAESGIKQIPERYIKPVAHRYRAFKNKKMNIPVINLENAFSEDEGVREETLQSISKASREWGFFQIVNHGVRPELLKSIRQVWRDFFNLPLESKQLYANSPCTYEGYGSRLGVEKGAILDWSDYFFLNSIPSQNNCPSSCRGLVAEYGEQLVQLGGKLMRIFSNDLGLDENHLLKAFGGDDDDIGACLRVNFYPKCPQPDLTLGLSPHSDPGGITILLPDHEVSGLQVRVPGEGEDNWLTVKPLPNAFIINIGDQMQVLTNSIYKSVEHRVIVNSKKDRLSLAMFYNPRSDLIIQPCQQFVTKETPALYQPMTFHNYRTYIRTKGPSAKKLLQSFISH
ncbi:jasmonate-induced oxygenase 2-like [Euphorbia lathyris]|uniref:jasmonate-induced oxygenase 2-like n=1 Tax=Euphorbia lathyris TaxID=212925 RepID=UPI003313BC65